MRGCLASVVTLLTLLGLLMLAGFAWTAGGQVARMVWP